MSVFRRKHGRSRPLAIATVLACVTAATGLAAGSTEVEQFSDTFPDNNCGFSGTTVVHGTSVFRDTGNGTFFASGTFFAVLDGPTMESQPRSPSPGRSSKPRRP